MSFAPWIDYEISSAMAIQNTIQLGLKLDRDNGALQGQYKYQRNRGKSLLRNAKKKKYYGEHIHNCSGNAAITWKIARNIVPNK